ncbi:MAG: hypothetical protein N2319_11640 [Candidatus Kapabacteria bacterium]|nr:hypothetical protein [Candidatus Kapabacteria bacterium]
MNIIAKIIAYLLIVTGELFITLFTFGLFTGNEITYILVGLILLGLLPFGIGFFILKKFKTLSQKELETKFEAELMRLAAKYKGRLKVTDVTVNMSLTLEDSKTLLEKYVIKGLATTEVTNEGTIVYVFRDFIEE